MKRCPKCDRLFEESTVNFCRSDGSPLVSKTVDEDATVWLPIGPISRTPPRLLPVATSSIAVLPFSNLTSDPDNEYLCAGLAGELVQALTRIENLRVTAPTSAFSFKRKDVSVREIGRVLNVAAVLEGSVRKSKDKMRITVQLVSAKDGYQLWSERYDRELNATFDLQANIALAVVKALDVTLRGPERSAISKRHTENAKAHQLYLRGRLRTASFTPETFRASVDHLHEALAEDPNYALAYAALADTYYQASGVHLRPAESLAQVKAAAGRALQLDASLAEAHTLLGVVAANYDRMPEVAEDRFKRGLELAPNSVLAHQLYGCYLMTQGRLAAAIAEFCRAQELDPLSPVLRVLISVTYFFARQAHKSLRHARKALAIDDNYWLGYWAAALAHEQFGELVEALGQLEKARERERSPWITALRARVYAKLGKRDVAEAILEEINIKAATEWVAPYLVATAYFALDEIDRGFEWLERAFDEYDENLRFIAVDPIMDASRNDPRFMDLLRRVGLNESTAKTHFIVPVSDCLSAEHSAISKLTCARG